MEGVWSYTVHAHVHVHACVSIVLRLACSKLVLELIVDNQPVKYIIMSP